MKKKIWIAIIYLLCFLSGCIASFFLGGPYRTLVLFLFKLFQGDKIAFVGKNFYLFPSAYLTYSLGVFFALMFWVIKRSTIRILTTIGIIIGFFLTTIIISYYNSWRFVIECTACNDGFRHLRYGEVRYDNYFLISLVVDLVPVMAIHYWFFKKETGKL